MKVRTADPRFLEAARKYMLEVGRQLAPLQITRGGPIIMVQVENEYGEFGKDLVYLGAVEQMIRDAGFDVTLFTSERVRMPGRSPAGRCRTRFPSLILATPTIPPASLRALPSRAKTCRAWWASIGTAGLTIGASATM